MRTNTHNIWDGGCSEASGNIRLNLYLAEAADVFLYLN